MLQFTQSLYKYNPSSEVNDNMKFNILELYAETGRSMEPFLDWSQGLRRQTTGLAPFAEIPAEGGQHRIALWHKLN